MSALRSACVRAAAALLASAPLASALLAMSLAGAALVACKAESALGSGPVSASASSTERAASVPAVTASALAPEPDPAMARADAARQVPKLLDLTEALARVHAVPKQSCTALVAALRAWHAEHGAALQAIPALTFGEVEREPEAKQRLRSHMEQVMNAGMKCKDDADFAALQRELTQPR